MYKIGSSDCVLHWPRPQTYVAQLTHLSSHVLQQHTTLHYIMQVERRRQTRKTSNTTRTQTQQKTVEFVELYADVLALISLRMKFATSESHNKHDSCETGSLLAIT